MIGIACFISGGYISYWTDSVLVYDADNLYGSPIETSMVNARGSHACTIFQSELHGGRPVAIVAGGLPESVYTKAEIWDYTQEGTSWVESKIISVFQFWTMKCFRTLITILYQKQKINSIIEI